MRKQLAVGALALGLVGCAGINKSMTYNDVKHISFRSPNIPIGFWIFDHPGENKLLINQDPGSAAGAGFAKGLTLGIVDTSSPVQYFEQGANEWLASAGRHCKVTHIERVLAPTNYEATYQCDDTATPVPAKKPS